MILDCMHIFTAEIGTPQLTTVLQRTYEQRFITDDKMWPSNQFIFHDYVPQSLMYHQGRYCMKETDLMMELIHMNGTHAVAQEDINHNHRRLKHILNQNKLTKITKNIAEIFTSLDKNKFFLIEGFQGMGKTIILKEIAYRWAKNELLTSCKIVFLVCCQDPKVHKLKTWNDFVQYYCDESGFPKKIMENAFEGSTGKNTAFLFDSFEEFPIDLLKDSFVYKVLKGGTFPECALVIASCPHASAGLRPKATVRVCLLGFTEMKQQKKFIELALQDHQQVKEVTQHLEHDSTLSSLCVSPIHMIFLLHIYVHARDLFFSNVGKLYEHVLCLIILCCHLVKYDSFCENNTYNLNNLPAQCKNLLTQIGKLSVANPKLKIFTWDDINKTFPDLLKTSGASNHLGLLQAVKYDVMTGKTMKFGFRHPIIQEALAAHHNQIPNSQLKCLRSFKTHFETGNKEFCRRIINAQVFDYRTINLRGTSLLTSDIKCLTLIFTQSPHHEWEEVDLHGCDIKDDGIVILHKELINRSITIKKLSLSNNSITMSSLSKIHDIVIHCAVKVFAIRLNRAVSTDLNFYSLILSNPDSVVEQLYMNNSNYIPSSAITNIFSVLEKNKKLKVLRTINSNITDHNCDAIVRMLRSNTTLVELEISSKQITAKNAKRIIKALAFNNTLEYLVLPLCKPKHLKDIAELAKKVGRKFDIIIKNHHRRCMYIKV